MKIVRDETLAQFRGPGLCLLCGRWYLELDPHHAFIKRGCGGGTRLDLAENLAPLCRTCHTIAESCSQAAADVQYRVTQRHGCDDPGVIRDWLQQIVWLPKGSELPERTWKAT